MMKNTDISDEKKPCNVLEETNDFIATFLHHKVEEFSKDTLLIYAEVIEKAQSLGNEKDYHYTLQALNKLKACDDISAKAKITLYKGLMRFLLRSTAFSKVLTEIYAKHKRYLYNEINLSSNVELIAALNELNTLTNASELKNLIFKGILRDLARMTNATCLVLKSLIEIFPQHKQAIYKQMMKNFERFSYRNSYDLETLVELFPEKEDELVKKFMDFNKLTVNPELDNQTEVEQREPSDSDASLIGPEQADVPHGLNPASVFGRQSAHTAVARIGYESAENRDYRGPSPSQSG